LYNFFLQTGTPVGLVEDKVPLSGYEPPFRKLKHISSQVILHFHSIATIYFVNKRRNN
jgi:hypothetical protein